ncbi:MAG: HlyD family efflux transporter periplasmic adaptor subunit [Planctomycetes bacterium]|nr:HlyD family efflux transporter periplasmic adaptor subunit [Planctomycetota bacterium]
MGTVAASILGVAVVGSGIYFYSAKEQTKSAVETHQVERRTFAVMLNEKGELEAKDTVNVKVEVEGRSTIVWMIDEGTAVKKGDLVARIASNEIDEKIRAEEIKVQNAKASAEAADQQFEIMLDQNASDIRKAELALTNAGIELRKYLEGDSVQMFAKKENTLRTSKIKLEQAEDVLKDSHALREKGHLSKRDYERDVLAQIEAKDAVDAADIDLRTFKTYTDPKDRTQKESDVSEAQKDLVRTKKKAVATEAKDRAQTAAKHSEHELMQERLTKLLEQRDKTELRAPADGMVVYDVNPRNWPRRAISEGEEVYERQSIIKLPNPSVMLVKVRIHESKTGLIALGQRVAIEVEGIPDIVFEGTVTKIAPLADSQGGWLNPDMKEYATEIELDSTDHELKPGVTARANILVNDVVDVLAVPIQAIYGVGEKHFAFVGRSRTDAKAVEVEVGATSDTYVEVRSGLSEGDTVLLTVDEILVAALPSDDEKSNGFEGSKPHAAKKQTVDTKKDDSKKLSKQHASG